jgi:hypothetical protein
MSTAEIAKDKQKERQALIDRAADHLNRTGEHAGDGEILGLGYEEVRAELMIGSKSLRGAYGPVKEA